MSCRTIFSQIQVESIIFFLKSKFFHSSKKLVIIILSLASSDDLSDSRYKTVYSCYCLAIFVHLHIESFDLLRIICYKYRTFVYLLCQIALMLCLKVASPGYFIIKLIIVFLKNLYCLCVCYTCKVRVHYIMKSVKKSFINERVEEVHLFRCILKYIVDHILQHSLSQFHIIFKICKCNLRLDHPELCRMSCCVRVLCAECRSKCINITECLCISLSVKLTTYCKACLFSKEILCIIYSPILILWNIIHIQCCNTEHLSCTLTVTSCDQRSVYIYKSSVLEELVNRICCQRTNSEYSLECVCSRTEMRNCSKILKAVTLLLQWIIRCGCSFDHNLFCLDLKWLLSLWCCYQCTLNNDCCSYIQFGNLSEVLHLIMIYNL